MLAKLITNGLILFYPMKFLYSFRFIFVCGVFVGFMVTHSLSTKRGLEKANERDAALLELIKELDGRVNILENGAWEE